MMEVSKLLLLEIYGTAQGLDILPKTAELLKNENIKFVIVGDGRYQEELKREDRKTRCAETVHYDS